MAELDTSFPARRPISVWNRLSVNREGFYASLTAWIALASNEQGWPELPGMSLELLKNFRIEERDAPQLAWLLIQRSLLSAMADLTKETGPVRPRTEGNPLKELASRLDSKLDGAEVEIDSSFFRRPTDLPLLEAVKVSFAEWLEAYGLPSPDAESISQRLPSYFAVALHTEWGRGAAAYAPIRDAVDTPFTRAAERERAWAAYGAYLQKQVEEPMFGEAFGLRQVYVPLRGFYFDRPPAESAERFAGGRESESPRKRVAVDLAQELDRWLLSEDRNDGYRVLSGGPGSGKSSLARMWAARQSEQGSCRLVFIPLHQLNLTGKLESAVDDFVRLSEILPGNPLDPETGEERLLLVLDGLDELAQQGRVAAEIARDFVREALNVMQLRNHQRRRLLVVFTGREPVVQASESEFRDPRRVLHVLPYVVTDHKAQDWRSGTEILAVDQRDAWWQLYGRAKGAGYTGIPKELRREDLADVTAQPLLNYLAALSVSQGTFKSKEALNLNDIYEDLLKAVHERTYERRPHTELQGVSLGEFRRVLEEIALSAWHGNGRTTTVAEIESHCKTAGLTSLLERFAKGAKSGVSRVLTAFYFRQFGRTSTGYATFEFTHKSFREYLTAVRILRALGMIEEEVKRRDESFDRGWDERAALKHWAEICGPTALDRDLLRFVGYEVSRLGPEKASDWQALLCRLIGAMLRAGMPMESVEPRIVTYKEQDRQARNAEEALLAVLSACSAVTQALSRIHWPGESRCGRGTSAGEWIGRLRGQRMNVDGGLALDCLSRLDLTGCVLHICDLYEANLGGSRLEKAGLEMANLIGANLTEANLTRVEMGRADMPLANLTEANLAGANLSQANLTNADLIGADLTWADLTGADLTGADLTGANLAGANLSQANLTNADLTGADLTGADLTGANLSEAVGLPEKFRKEPR